MLFNWDVSRIQRSFSGQVFEAFATGICVLTVQNPSPELLRIGWILSVCVSWAAQLFADRFLDQFEQEFICNFRRKITHSKKGIQGEIRRRTWLDFGLATLPRSLHSPQVATAAPPFPSVYLVASQLETCTCGATCPRGFNSSFKPQSADAPLVNMV